MVCACAAFDQFRDSFDELLACIFASDAHGGAFGRLTGTRIDEIAIMRSARRIFNRASLGTACEGLVLLARRASGRKDRWGVLRS